MAFRVVRGWKGLKQKPLRPSLEHLGRPPVLHPHRHSCRDWIGNGCGCQKGAILMLRRNWPGDMHVSVCTQSWCLPCPLVVFLSDFYTKSHCHKIVCTNRVKLEGVNVEYEVMVLSTVGEPCTCMVVLMDFVCLYFSWTQFPVLCPSACPCQDVFPPPLP